MNLKYMDHWPVQKSLDCLQSAFSLEVRRVFNPKQARLQKSLEVVKQNEIRARRENSSRQDLSRHSHPKFVHVCVQCTPSECYFDGETRASS